MHRLSQHPSVRRPPRLTLIKTHGPFWPLPLHRPDEGRQKKKYDNSDPILEILEGGVPVFELSHSGPGRYPVFVGFSIIDAMSMYERDGPIRTVPFSLLCKQCE